MAHRQPLGSFDIDATTHVAPKHLWQVDERPEPPFAFSSLFDWVSEEAPYRQLGGWVKSLYYSKLLVPDDSDWIGERPLGAGSFGVVALFRKQNTKGEIVDRVVIKTTQVWSKGATAMDRLDLSTEAEIMRQLNMRKCEGVLALRNFKYHATSQEWRYYLEYCPYGDLEKLRRRYYAWGHHFPELFLWYIFKWLAEGGRALEQAPFVPWSGQMKGQKTPGSYVLHNDLKEANTFLGYSVPSTVAETQIFPTAKLADFGLSDIEYLESLTAVAAELQQGTPVWKAPELRQDHFHPRSRFYPFIGRVPLIERDTWDPNEPPPSKLYHTIGPESNRFAIGMAMWCLITLEEPHVLDNAIEWTLKTENPLPGGHFWPEIRSNQPDELEYSKELRSLVRQCISLHPLDRPSAPDLVAEIDRNIERVVEQLTSKHNGSASAVAAATKVYYRDNEINDLPPGPYRHRLPMTSHHWNNLDEQDKFQDPEWGVLYPPGHPWKRRPDPAFPS